MKVKETAKKPYGICPASMTIWNADQTYNKKGMEKYLTWLLDNGAQSISICGSTGENVAMNMEEQCEIIGHVDAVTCSAAEAASNIASGELKVLAVANTERLEAYPDVPTFQEVGVDLTIVALRGLCVNKDPPDDVKKALCDGFEKVINSDACREKIEAANMTYMPLNAQETNDILDSMSGNFEKIINAYLNSAN